MTKHGQIAIAAFLFMGASIFAGVTATAQAQGSDTFERFAEHAEFSAARPDYAPIEDFLRVFAKKESGRLKIAYASAKGTGEAFLQQYVSYLADFDVASLSKDDQLAYWLNFRSILVVQAVAGESRRRNLSDERGTGAQPGPLWTDKRVTVSGVELSIDDIEQRILLANWDDPHVLYGLYQGVEGGPRLMESGFDGNAVREQLVQIGRDFVRSKEGLRLRRGKAQVSALFDWYKQPLFDNDDQKLRAHLKGLADDETGQKLDAVTEFEPRRFDFAADEYVIRQQRNTGVGGFGSVTGSGS